MKTGCFGKVAQGKFIPSNTRSFRDAFAFHEGKEVELTVERKKKRRSNNQNAYYHGVVVPMIAQAMGEDSCEDVHNYLKAEFNWKYIVIGDEEKKFPQSTAKLSTAEFSEYVAKIQRWASEFLSLYVPDPNEYYASVP